MAEYRLQELASLSGVSARNIRAYRGRGLLDPPRREGRSAFYNDHHLSQLRTINELLRKGFKEELAPVPRATAFDLLDQISKKVPSDDEIVLDVGNGRLDVTLDPVELQRRRDAWSPTPRPAPRGVLAKYVKLVRSANVGAICG